MFAYSGMSANMNIDDPLDEGTCTKFLTVNDVSGPDEVLKLI